ncbi:flagellar basal body rod protein FlgB [Gallaecimonas pentaromativorans]|uniref:Flagellar basal body rod protein FlgB n=1 Tax=Gallaecimonas pentaromativorans TaxID=584787 RepID=A0A3N1PEY7_9GAMM|nr:flagellar basal body rod protein FlgB [Gallaecimonas pentaromativorans]MED5526533.1 flagellar basal body rod protein FlgB [Pseudomonadota bacterium]ROQ25871.1 flagellar basal-body rod protein FlgB [Gallaecimonas pentaromativorans]
MGISVDKALGVHQYALAMQVERSRVIAGNLANVDTPGYLARDYDFKTALKDVASGVANMSSQDRLPDADFSSDLRYRVPMQPSEDGNTSELGVEQTQFASNAMDFQTSLTFLNLTLGGIRKAIEGQ